MASAHASAPLDGRLDALLLGVLFTQARSALLVFDAELRLLRANASARRLPGVPEEAEGRPAGGGETVGEKSAEGAEHPAPAAPAGAPAARDVGAVADGGELERLLRLVLTTADPVRNVRMAGGDGDQRVLSVSAYPLNDGGAPVAVLAHVRDITDRRRSRDRLELLYAAEARTGALLDVGRVARELAAVVVPALADTAVVDIVDAVWRGEDSAPGPAEELPLRRAAVAPAAYQEGESVGTLVRYPYASPQSSALTDLRPRLLQGPGRAGPANGAAPDRVPAPEPEPADGPGAGAAGEDAHSRILAPLLARGTLLGLVSLYRSAHPVPFDDADLRLATEVADARDLVRRRLTGWGLHELALPTELIVSELLANAVRHAPGRIGLKLIRQSVLICEVSDTSHAAPHLRHATSNDEGGRGLFLVAQLSHRWGIRYGADGKVVWTEQEIPRS